MDEGVIEGRKDAGNAEDELALIHCQYAPISDTSRVTHLADLGSELDVLLRTALDLLLGRHVDCELDVGWLIRGGLTIVFIELLVGSRNSCVRRNVAPSLARYVRAPLLFLQLRQCKPASSSLLQQHGLSPSTTTAQICV